MNKETPNPKCGCCKCYWKPDENDISTSGLLFKSCRKCREYSRNYFENNWEQICVNVECECGKTVYKKTMYRHKKSKEHLEYLEKKKNELS